MLEMTRENDKAVIRPTEEDVVAVSVPEFRRKMRSAIAEGTRELTLDLANVHMVDSMGIGLLISAHNTLQKLGGKLAVVHASKDILDLFRMMRIHQHFSVSGE